jgi:hypothetical protein
MMEDAQLDVDFLNKESFLTQLSMEVSEHKPLLIDTKFVDDSNAIKRELRSFAASIHDGLKPAVSLVDAHRALQIAELISEQIQAANNVMK